MIRFHLLLYIAVAKARYLPETIDATLLDARNQANQKRVYETVDNQNVGNNPLISIIKNQDFKKIKKRLDAFSMERRKTYTIKPRDGLRDNNYLKNKIVHKRDVNRNSIIQKKGINQKSNPSDDLRYNFYNDPRVSLLMRTQTTLMSNLLKLLERERQSERSGKKKSDFDELIDDIEAKYNVASIEDYPILVVSPQSGRVTVQTVPTTTPKLSTIMTLIDETEVRRALRNNPFVKRILKLANRKREIYLKRANEIAKTNHEAETTLSVHPTK